MAEQRNGSPREVERHESSDDVIGATLTAQLGPSGDDGVIPSSDARSVAFKIQSEQGRGGVGRVLRARDLRLERTVAIKELLHRVHTTEKRFLHEAKITARLQHPGVVPIYEAGRWANGTPFYVMKLVQGRTLRDVIQRTSTLDERLALLPKLIAVAETIAYAHSEGIVHRDLKPANVIVGAFGETVVIDWGLAKELTTADDSDSSGGPYRAPVFDHTSEGAILGTPSYMAPEQARGERVDRRADVYALGAILYNVLAGCPPHSGTTAREVLANVTSAAPIPVDVRQAGVPLELATIVGKAMAAVPAARYDSAADFAEDLKRFQTGQLVSAHNYSIWALTRRWLARYRLAVAVAATLLVVMIAGAMLSVSRIIKARKLAEHERTIAIARQSELTLLQAKSSLESDPTLAMAWLKVYPASGSDSAFAQAVAVDAQSRGVARHLLPARLTDGLVFTRDGVGLVSGADKRLCLWNSETGSLLDSIPFDSELLTLSIDRSGMLVAAAGLKGEVVLWDLAARKWEMLGRHVGSAFQVALSPDARLVASSGFDGINVWNRGTGEKRFISGHKGAIRALGFSADSRWLASGGDDGQVRVWDAQDATSRLVGLHAGAVNAVVFARDAATIISGSEDHAVIRWQLAGEHELLGRHDDGVTLIGVSPAQNVIASVSHDHVIKMWDLNARSETPLIGHTDLIHSIEFSNDGAILASAGRDRQVILWDLNVGTHRVLHGHNAAVAAVAFSGDGTRLASGGNDPFIRVWKLPPPYVRVFRGHTESVGHVVFSPDGKLVASDSRDSSVRLWDLQTGSVKVLRGHKDKVYGISFSSDSKRLASAGWDNTARLWNVATGESRVLAGNDAFVRRAIFSPDGSLVATAGGDGTIRLWNVARKDVRILKGHTGEVACLSFSPDGSMLASTGDDATVRIWDVATGTGRIADHHSSPAHGVLFSPDGEWIASLSGDHAIRLWQRVTGQVRLLTGHDALIPQVAFSPDGKLLASASWDGTARIWNLADGSSRVLRGHERRLRSVAWRPDGAQLATGADDTTIRTWNLVDGSAQVLRGHTSFVRYVAYSPDGKTLASASDDRTVRVWYPQRAPYAPSDMTALHGWLDEQTSATLETSGVQRFVQSTFSEQHPEDEKGIMK